MDQNEEQLQARDEQVTAAIGDALTSLLENAEEHRGSACEAEDRAFRIRKAVLAGEWWKLKGILSAETIESLCNCELTNRADYLPGPPED